jgi:hypothetical protein
MIPVSCGRRETRKDRADRDWCAVVRKFDTLAPAFPQDFDPLFYGGGFVLRWLRGRLHTASDILRAMRGVGFEQLFAAGDGCCDVSNFLEPAGDTSASGEGFLVLSATSQIGHGAAVMIIFDTQFGSVIANGMAVR